MLGNIVDACKCHDNKDDEILRALLEPFGVQSSVYTRKSPPILGSMNEVVERADSKAERKVMKSKLSQLHLDRVEKFSSGWHEGYGVTYRLDVAGKGGSGSAEQQEKEYGFLRIFRGELSYWRLDTPISGEMEIRAQQICKEAGLASVGDPVAKGKYEHWPASFVKNFQDFEADMLEPCDWTLSRFVPFERKVHGNDDETIALLAKLHKYNLTDVDTGPLPRFDNVRSHLEYLTKLMDEHVQKRATVHQSAGSINDAAASEWPRGFQLISEAFGNVGADIVKEPQTLWPALCHLDMHSGNILMEKCKETGEKKLKAIIDWEFAGV